MTNEEFRATAHAVWGYRWKDEAARFFNVDERNVRRWAKNGGVPEFVDREFLEKFGANYKELPIQIPRDEWVVQRWEQKQRAYVIHTREPRFIVRVVRLNSEGGPLAIEHPVDVINGFYADDILCDAVLCEIDWIDMPPAQAEYSKLLELAACAFYTEWQILR